MFKNSGVDVASCDDGGGISVKGDTTINYTGVKPLTTAVALLLALGAGGAATAMFYGHKPTDPPAIIEQPGEPQTGNWRLGLIVTDKP